MIHSIVGTVTNLQPDGIHFQVGAIEWHLLASQQTLNALHIGEDLKLYTYLHHKEDTMQLFAFKEKRERDIFFHLIKVDGVGPKAALKILGFFTPVMFQEAIEAPDIKLLAKAPGLGAKTAQKIMLALKGKLDFQALNTTSSGSPTVVSNDDLLPPLVAMGFDRKTAQNTLQEVRSELGAEATEAEILRITITRLS
ncbi:Holliday junction branch migration protein RuvA [Entomospira entomophila]|uniref:Holliday junction branch migration complex subunit RuvA n=1 Tax=Entomospira entomophila TaxID=2719988 RepID=A0A968GAT5_9SPIO|nr:Holliday junction branch migration protein RuvA [Entomospira entomophilus]NIZ40960.1 Holliday junction branch migration protein RuvA [Entomospira entomophilus]WDI35173.1 Holliday junction branch migration protein RuvA [Entomospira entomophilus]